MFSSQDQQIDGDCWPTDLIFTCKYVEITLVRFTQRNFKQGAENVNDIKHVAKVSPAIPADDPRRNLVVANPDNSNARHLGVVGDTYTILLSGMDTAGRFTVIDMHVPPGGGPPPHRHDFEETFILLDSELQATFRKEKRILLAGETVHIPANAPHQFHNAGVSPCRCQSSLFTQKVSLVSFAREGRLAGGNDLRWYRIGRRLVIVPFGGS